MGRIDRYFGLFLVVPALGMAAWAGYTAARWTLAHLRPAIPCIIQASRIREGQGDHAYLFDVRYRYAYGGRWFRGATFREDYRGSWEIAEADRLVRAFPVGAQRACYVNPWDPSEAILEPDNPLLPLGLAVAMLACGSVLARTFIRGCYDLERLGGPFVGVMGLAGYLLFFAMPLRAGVRSLGWRPTPCVVESGQVRQKQNHGLVSFTTYWPDVVFRYRVGGRAYRSNTWNASFVGSPWYYGSRGVVRRYPQGRRTTCYVNPADPSEAVLDRRVSGTQLFGVGPLLMAILGAVGAVQSVTGREVRFGTPRLWGTLALGSTTVVAAHVFLATGSDLLEDWRAGIADRTEGCLVLASGLVAAALLVGWIALAASHGRGHPDPILPYVWDGELDL